MAKTRNEIDPLTRRRILGALRANEFNYQKTAKETGISRQTLIRWAKTKEGKAILHADIIEVSKDERGREVVIDKVLVGKELYSLKRDIIEKMKGVLIKCNDLDTLSRCLKIVSDVEQANDMNGDNLNHLNNAQGFIELIYKKLTISKTL